MSIFYKEFIGLGSSNINIISPYILSFKWLNPQKSGFRSALGANISKRNESVDRNSSKIVDNQSIDLRLGYEFNLFAEKRFRLYSGIDVVAGLEKMKIITNSQDFNGFELKFETIRTIQTIGAGPVLGFQYNLTKRLNLFTEANFYFKNDEFKTEIIIPDQEDLNSSDIESEKTLNLVPPFFIVLNYTL